MWRINGPKQIVKVILCCGRYRDGNRDGRHGNAAGSFGGFNSQTYADASTIAPSFEITRVEERRVYTYFSPLSRGKRSKGEGTGEKGAYEMEREREREGDEKGEKRERYGWAERGKSPGEGSRGGRMAKVRDGGK